MDKNKRLLQGFCLASALIVISVPLYVHNTYVLKILCNVMLYSIIAISTNLIVGFCGQLDFGRAAFAGLGAYFSAYLYNTTEVPFLLCFVSGGLFAALMGAVLGTLCRKTSFDYLTLVTIGFLEICRKLFVNWRGITNGNNGLATRRPSFGGITLQSHTSMFYFCLVLLIVSYILIKRITRSKLGRAFMAVRDDSIAAAYSGIDVPRYKTICFSLGSFFTGIAGAALAHYTMFTSPANYTQDQSIIMLQMVILGGLGSLPGSIIGAALLTILPEISRSFYEYRLLFMGVLMVILMLFAPQGLLGRGGIKDKLLWHLNKRRRRNAAEGGESRFG